MSAIFRGAHYDEKGVKFYLTLARSLPRRTPTHNVHMVIRDHVALRLLNEATTDEHYRLAVFVLAHPNAFPTAKVRAEEIVIYVSEHPDEFSPEIAAHAASSITVIAD